MYKRQAGSAGETGGQNEKVTGRRARRNFRRAFPASKITNMEHLNLQALADNLSLFAFIYLCVFGAIVMDLWSGVRKARRRHELRMSNGYKRTVDKIARYYNMLLVVDVYKRQRTTTTRRSRPSCCRTCSTAWRA